MTITYLTLPPPAMSRDIPWKIGSNAQSTASAPGSPPRTELLHLNPLTLLVSLLDFMGQRCLSNKNSIPPGRFCQVKCLYPLTTHSSTECDLSSWVVRGLKIPAHKKEYKWRLSETPAKLQHHKRMAPQRVLQKA